MCFGWSTNAFFKVLMKAFRLCTCVVKGLLVGVYVGENIFETCREYMRCMNWEVAGMSLNRLVLKRDVSL